MCGDGGQNNKTRRRKNIGSRLTLGIEVIRGGGRPLVGAKRVRGVYKQQVLRADGRAGREGRPNRARISATNLLRWREMSAHTCHATATCHPHLVSCGEPGWSHNVLPAPHTTLQFPKYPHNTPRYYLPPLPNDWNLLAYDRPRSKLSHLTGPCSKMCRVRPGNGHWST